MLPDACGDNYNRYLVDRARRYTTDRSDGSRGTLRGLANTVQLVQLTQLTQVGETHSSWEKAAVWNQPTTNTARCTFVMATKSYAGAPVTVPS